MTEARNYKIKGSFAVRVKIPSVVTAVKVKETEKAVYLFGHGSASLATKFGACCRCGRQLTHPGSMILGIGPECLGDWGMRDQILKGMSPEQIAETQGRILVEQKIDSWVPKSCITDMGPADEEITIPEEKKIEKKENKKAGVILENGLFIVSFPYDKNLLEKVKAIPGRRWLPNEKVWTVPANETSYASLTKIGFLVPESNGSPNKEGFQEKQKKTDINLKNFGRKLMPFQKDGLEFLHQKNGRALIADEMGLGKTIQALAYLNSCPDLRPALVICPASLKINWEREARIACPELIIEKVAGKSREALPKADLFIMNYDIVTKRIDDILEAKIKLMILDEAHYLKNIKAERTKTVLQKLNTIEKIIALTGTPIINRPIEIYHVAKALSPTQIPPFMQFAKRYCAAYKSRFGWDFSGASNTAEMHALLTNTIMLRRLKNDVLKDLPEKTRTVIPMEMQKEELKEYKKAEKNFINWLRETNPEKVTAARKAEALARLQALKRLACKGKWANTVEWINDALETNGKMILFAVHHDTIDKLMQEFSQFNPVKIDGRDNQIERQAAIDRFHNDNECRLFIGSMKAAGVGITLTASSTEAFVELGWTPGEHLQAEDRAHRFGQKNAVNVYYLIANKTVEEEIAALLDKKRQVLSAVLDGWEIGSESLLTELLRIYLENNR